MDYAHSQRKQNKSTVGYLRSKSSRDAVQRYTQNEEWCVHKVLVKASATAGPCTRNCRFMSVQGPVAH